jgi:hypothetical protein
MLVGIDQIITILYLNPQLFNLVIHNPLYLKTKLIAHEL